MPADIAANLREVEERIAAACERAGRRRDEVTLVAVSKTFPASVLDDAIRAGIDHLGENRVQEFKAKARMLEGTARFHLIGHLQSNKARDAVRLFDVIQTIDSVALLKRVDRIAGEESRRVDVLVQVNVGDEAQKAGVDPLGVEDLVREGLDLEYARVVGLMAIPPIADGDATRSYFREMRRIQQKLEQNLGAGSLRELSIGMSEDYEIAVEEGATMIRVGRAIFGERS